MGLFSKHVPDEPRDPRPKGTNWKDPGHIKMAVYLSSKENRKLENEAFRKWAEREDD